MMSRATSSRSESTESTAGVARTTSKPSRLTADLTSCFTTIALSSRRNMRRPPQQTGARFARSQKLLRKRAAHQGERRESRALPDVAAVARERDDFHARAALARHGEMDETDRF